jgi:hypothetical protein
MATCALLGQAAGTAAAFCVRDNALARDFSHGEKLRELQQTLMEDDCFLPGFARTVSPLACSAHLSGSGENVAALRDGCDRDREDESHTWKAPPGSSVQYTWDEAVAVEGVRLVFDSNLSHEKRMPCAYPLPGDASRTPSTLVKDFRLEVLDAEGNWQLAHRETNNFQRQPPAFARLNHWNISFPSFLRFPKGPALPKYARGWRRKTCCRQSRRRASPLGPPATPPRLVLVIVGGARAHFQSSH